MLQCSIATIFVQRNNFFRRHGDLSVDRLAWRTGSGGA